jgi:hypothetical protein
MEDLSWFSSWRVLREGKGFQPRRNTLPKKTPSNLDGEINEERITQGVSGG